MPIPAPIDHRSDVYALGRLLYVALSGEDGAVASGRLALRRRNRQVSVGLSDVIDTCLAANPDDRYANAATVAADLRGHLAHLPLRGAPNRSLRERWQKWRRRRPNAPLWAALVLALTGTGAMLAGGAVGRYREAQAALIEGQAHLQRGAHAEAVSTLARGMRQVEHLPGGRSLAVQLDRELWRARRAQSAADLHALAERLRYLLGADLHSTHELQLLEGCCRKAWEARETAADPTVKLDEPVEEQVRADLLDLALLWSDLRERLFQRGELGEDREETRAILAEAEALSGSGVARARERWPLSSLAESPASSTRTLASRSSWEHISLGRSLLRSGNLTAALEELKEAIALRPSDFWAHFYSGVCAYRRAQYAEAVHAFGVAIALAPTSAECYYNRGLVYAAWGKRGEAIRDYDRALRMAPDLGVAALNRGILHYQNGHHTQAKADLEQALQSGVDPAAAHYNLALVHLALRDGAAAQYHVNRALEHRATDAKIRALQRQLRGSN
jgi:tetratricopeptide (TPR) repeat protein